MNLEPEDIISNWTYSICRVPETYDRAMHLWAQNLQNELSFLVNIDYMVVFKCDTCGTPRGVVIGRGFRFTRFI